MTSVLDRIRSGPPIVADGGVGTLLSAAAPRLRCPEEANVREPDALVSLHLSFINAGAELIETNTFAANRRKLAARYLEDELVAINEAGVKLARDARQVSGREVFIAGSIGPLGENEDTWPEERGPFFAEQAQLLAGRGVDLFMVETFFDLEELVTAIEAVRSANRRADDLRRGGDPEHPRSHGDPREVGDYPGSGGVYEVDAIGLPHLISHSTAARTPTARRSAPRPPSSPGGAEPERRPSRPVELDRLRRKIDAGARFTMTAVSRRCA